MGIDGVHVWDDFTGGEWGRLGDLKSPKGSFSGLNVMRYMDGGIGPRPGWIDITPASGMPAATVDVRCFGFLTDPDPAPKAFFITSAGALYAFWTAGTVGSTGPAFLASGSTFSAPTGRFSFVSDSGFTYISNGTSIYKVTPGGGSFPSIITSLAVATIASPPTVGPLAIYGTRLLCAGSSPSNRLYYSAPGDYTSWPAANYIDIGDADPITVLTPLRDRVLIFKRSSVWQLTGVPGFNDEVRYLGAIRGPSYSSPVLPDVYGSSFVRMTDPAALVPATFDGLNFRSTNHLVLASAPAGVCRGPHDEDEIVYTLATDALIAMNGAWFRASVPAAESGGHRFIVPSRSQTHVFVCQQTGTVIKVYALDLNVDRPGVTTDLRCQPGDASTTPLSASLTLSRLFAPVGGAVKLRKLFVDGTKYNTGSASTNHFDVAVTASHTDGAGANITSSTYSFDEATSAAGSVGAGKAHRHECHMGEQGWGGSLQVAFTNVRGWKIDRVTALYETRKAAG